MSRFLDERPDFESMDQKTLIEILDRFRELLKQNEDAGGFCQTVAERLGVDLRYGAYDDEV